MTRSCFLLLAGLAGFSALTPESQAGNKLFVGGLSWTTSDFAFVDKSVAPGTAVQDVSISLRDAREGTPQNPGNTLPASSSVGIVNPGPEGLGDAGFLDVFYSGSPSDFPTSSFFNVFLDIADPDTGQSASTEKGTVKFFNEQKGFGFIVSGQVPGAPKYSHSLMGEINPAQPGLSFVDLLTIRGEPGGLNFDGIDVLPELHFDGTGSINPALPLYRITITNVPEPATQILAAVGLVAFMAVARNRRMPAV